MSQPLAAARILVVDDDPFIGSLLNSGLTVEGFRVSVVQDGLEALAWVGRDHPDLVLLDIELPGLSGDEVCRRLKSNPATQFIPIIMITALTAGPNKVHAWHYGADEFLTKPFHLSEVVARCRSLLRIKRLIEERDSAESVVFALALAVEAKSPFTHGHSERVMHRSLALATAAGLDARQCEVLRKGALLHDIGKISIPDAILDKPGKLTDQEWRVVREHTLTGARIVGPLVSLREALPLIRSHHERLDGKGYPDGLAGDDIPLMVRILSVCDVYDSLASDRPYRPAIGHDECLRILHGNAQGGGLDRDVVHLLEGLLSAEGDEPAAELVFTGGQPGLSLLPQDEA
jgi:putative two-component system response regulator